VLPPRSPHRERRNLIQVGFNGDEYFLCALPAASRGLVREAVARAGIPLVISPVLGTAGFTA
jgi:hypothetical protein